MDDDLDISTILGQYTLKLRNSHVNPLCRRPVHYCIQITYHYCTGSCEPLKVGPSVFTSSAAFVLHVSIINNYFMIMHIIWIIIINYQIFPQSCCAQIFWHLQFHKFSAPGKKASQNIWFVAIINFQLQSFQKLAATGQGFHHVPCCSPTHLGPLELLVIYKLIHIHIHMHTNK